MPTGFPFQGTLPARVGLVKLWRSPNAVQHETVRGRSGAVTNSVFDKVSVLQRTTCVLRCAQDTPPRT